MKNRSLGTIKYYLYVVASIFISMPFFLAAVHSNYASDDFAYVTYIRESWRGSLFSTAVITAIERWREMEGRWFANFYDVFCHPYFRHGIKSLHLLLVMLIIMSIIGLLLFCFALVKYLGLKREKAGVLYFLIMAAVLLYREYWEVYMWFSGTIYQLTTMLFLWGFACLLFATIYKKIWLYIVSGVFLVCMGGCMFNFIGVGCLAIFLLLILEYIKDKKINMPLLIVFTFTCASSLLTLLAPGNFIRNDLDADKITLMQAILNSFLVMGRSIWEIAFKTSFVGIALVAFLFGMRQKRHLSKSLLIILLPIQFLMVYATILPFVFGYNVMGSQISQNRANYFIDITIMVSSIIICMVSGMIVKNRNEKMTIVLKTLAVFAFALLGPSLAETIPIKIITNYMDGSAKTYNDYWAEVFDTCESSKGEFVVIDKKIPDRVEGTINIVLKEEPYYPNNRNLTKMYELENISIIGED